MMFAEGFHGEKGLSGSMKRLTTGPIYLTPHKRSSIFGCVNGKQSISLCTRYWHILGAALSSEHRGEDECRIWQILWYPVFVESDCAVLRSAAARGYPRDGRIIWCSENFLLGWFENQTDESARKGLEITAAVYFVICVFANVFYRCCKLDRIGFISTLIKSYQTSFITNIF